MPLLRRDFLKLSAAGAGLALAPRSRAQQPATLTPSPAEHSPARNVIFMVADGMSSGTLQLADLYSRRTRNRPLRWTSLWTQPHVRRATCSTYSANGWVTDSAAAASTWGIGERVNNGSVNITPDGREPEPILITARKAGKTTGLVTTTRITHATPAGFYANCPKRDLEADIGAQLLDRRIDVAFGGGFDNAYIGPKALASRSDLTLLRTRADLLAHRATGPVLGLFDESHLRYSLDRPDTQPTIAEMTTSALSLLSARPGGFILQIEGGRVDQAAHANDAAAILADMLAFDDAIAVAHDFAAAHPDTLVVITSDHGCGNPGLTYYAGEGKKAFEHIQGAKHSFEWIESELARAGDTPEKKKGALPDLITHATGVTLDPDQLKLLMRCIDGEQVDPFRPRNVITSVLGSLLANTYGIAFISPNHSSDFVEVTALGPGSETLPAHIENVWFHPLLLASARAMSP